MNDQPQLNQQSQILNQQSKLAVMNPQQPPMMNPQPPPMMNQSQILTQSQPPLPSMLNRNYKNWPQQQFPSDPNNKKFHSSSNPNFVNPNQSMLGRSNWKNKKGIDKHKNPRRMENPIPNTSLGVPTSSGGYKPPTLNELQFQNRLKARKFYPKKKFNNRFAPYAPRNTTSFIIRAKKAGGIASLVSPCPVTPAVLPTPIFSPSREVLGDMAKEEWGVDGYGSMKGLIRLRSGHDEDDEEGGGSSESDVEEHVEVERRLDHDLSRFEMIYPNYGVDYNNVLENRVDDQDSHISQLEEENLTLKERLFLMERELQDLRRRLQCLERQKNHFGEDVNEEVVENVSENENDSDGESDVGAAPGVENVSGNVVRNFEANSNKEIFNELSEINGLKNENKEAYVSNANEGDSKDEADGCGI